jgi:predicted DNA-binding transcriptional regulator YafY
MRITANQTTEQTLTALLRAADRHHPVTITYTKADGTETLRTIEIHDVRTTKAGHVILRAADRQTGEMRTWRLDRIRAYSIHRTAYLLPVPADEAPAPTVVPATPAALVAFELGRDDRLTTTRARLAHAA